jgi:hypothetical protein
MPPRNAMVRRLQPINLGTRHDPHNTTRFCVLRRTGCDLGTGSLPKADGLRKRLPHPAVSPTSASHTSSLICLDSNVMCQGKSAYFALQLDTSGISSNTGDIYVSTSTLPSQSILAASALTAGNCRTWLTGVCHRCQPCSATVPGHQQRHQGSWRCSATSCSLFHTASSSIPSFPALFHRFFCTFLTGHTNSHPVYPYFIVYSLL